MCLYWYDEHDDVCNSVLSLVKSSAVKMGVSREDLLSEFAFLVLQDDKICNLSSPDDSKRRFCGKRESEKKTQG